jgi:hypothetical protein
MAVYYGSMIDVGSGADNKPTEVVMGDTAV